MEPRRIASYTLLEPIGHGGMAVVYRARQETLDRIVAVKVLSENLARSEEFIERFRREARTAANMRHPNVITVHDFGQDDNGVPYLVLEYVEGATLADLMDYGLDDVRVPDLLDQVAAGLDYAHSRGVIHRDVKPGNVLMTEDNRAVLADFGLAWLIEGAHLTMVGGVIGTPEYMSPEQASGDSIDHRTDVYALGVMLFEMLAGERPFTAAEPLGVLLKHLQAPVPSLLEARPDLSAEVDAVVQRALAKDPTERYQSAGELARAFRQAFAGQLQPATPTGSAAAGAATTATVGDPVPAPAPARTSAPGARTPASVKPSVPSAVESAAATPAAPTAASAASAADDPAATPAVGPSTPTEVPSPELPSPELASAELPSSELASAELAAAADAPDTAQADAANAPLTVTSAPCPVCNALIPAGAGICPACTYIVPLDQLPWPPLPRRIQRRELVVNLLPYRLRWDPPGLATARKLATEALQQAITDGWEPASIGDPMRLVEGRTIGGTVVRGAILTLERVA